jgi:ABC-type nitrate/sulfonate/bicarbonate transport system substrate-binding protein
VSTLPATSVLLAASARSGHVPSVSAVLFAPIPPPRMTAALKFEKIAAAVLPEPFASRTELALGVTSLADLDQGAVRAKRCLGRADHAG